MLATLAYTFPMHADVHSDPELVRSMMDLLAKRVGSSEHSQDFTVDQVAEDPELLGYVYKVEMVPGDLEDGVWFLTLESARPGFLEPSNYAPSTHLDIFEAVSRLTDEEKSIMDDLAALCGATAKWLAIRYDQSSDND